MKNFVQPGDTLTVTAPSGGVVSGTPYLIGKLFGVAAVTAAQGEAFALAVQGVFTMPKATGEAWAEGAALYWDDTAKNLTTTATSNQRVALAVKVAGSADTTGTALVVPFTGAVG